MMAFALIATMMMQTAAQLHYEHGLTAIREQRWLDAQAALLLVPENDKNRCQALYLLTIATAHLRYISDSLKYGDEAWECKPTLEKELLDGLETLRNWAHGIDAGRSHTIHTTRLETTSCEGCASRPPKTPQQLRESGEASLEDWIKTEDLPKGISKERVYDYAIDTINGREPKVPEIPESQLPR